MPTIVPDGYKPGDALTFGAFAGLRNDVKPDRMTIADLTLAKNVDLDNSGEVASRKGRRQLLAGQVHSIWSDGKQCLFVRNDQLTRLYPDLTTTKVIRGGLSPSRYLAYWSEDDRVYWSNGVDAGIIENDISRPWGIQCPAWPSLTAGVQGMLPVGNYQVTLAFEDADGRESGGSPAASIFLPDGGGIRIHFEPSDMATNIYLSPKDGDVAYWVEQIPPGVGDFVFSGGEQDQGRPFDKTFLIPCPGGHAIGWFGGRMYIVNGSFIYPSQPLAYELFDPYDVIEPDGSPVTVFAPVRNGIYVGTQTRVYFFSGSGPDDFTPNTIAEAGALAGSLAYAQGDDVLDGQAFGAAATPIFSIDNALFAGTQDGQLIPMSGPRYRHGEASKAAAVVRRGIGFQQYLAVFVQGVLP